MITEVSTLLDCFQTGIFKLDWGHSVSTTNHYESDDENLIKELMMLVDKFRVMLTAVTPFLPESIVHQLHLFYKDIGFFRLMLKEGARDIIDPHLMFSDVLQLECQFNLVIGLMQHDLGIELLPMYERSFDLSTYN
ncbi:MAG: hypothetical protein ABI480_00340 [Chitinophagaceae bacterium]